MSQFYLKRGFFWSLSVMSLRCDTTRPDLRLSQQQPAHWCMRLPRGMLRPMLSPGSRLPSITPDEEDAHFVTLRAHPSPTAVYYSLLLSSCISASRFKRTSLRYTFRSSKSNDSGEIKYLFNLFLHGVGVWDSGGNEVLQGTLRLHNISHEINPSCWFLRCEVHLPLGAGRTRSQRM